ncbi:hypothetical protein ElyMa_003750000 [Elysia marginata]|uniref:3'-phosphate/5'-hydroxy nucleic acid ligase n=1 Tax=Elysia marginata TaxID=1093978 RepID=A0AAV4F7W7_9GAST|nr:hypothetical protein ElyMa_003750000 [Elysia marginata]
MSKTELPEMPRLLTKENREKVKQGQSSCSINLPLFVTAVCVPDCHSSLRWGSSATPENATPKHWRCDNIFRDRWTLYFGISIMMPPCNAH